MELRLIDEKKKKKNEGEKIGVSDLLFFVRHFFPPKKKKTWQTAFDFR